jgi:hypothetical protein
MHLPEVVADNIKTFRDALNLIEISVEKPDVVELVLDSLDRHEQAELAKGMFIATKLLLRSSNSTYDRATIQKMSAYGLERIVHLLDAMDDDGGSFYLQLHRLNELPEIITDLILLFKESCFRHYNTNRNTDTLNVVSQFTAYVNKISEDRGIRDKERTLFVELMRKESESVEQALSLVETLAPHFVMDVTEDGQKVHFLNEKSLHGDEIQEAISAANPIELLKGVCIISCAFLSLYLTVGSIVPVLAERRAQLIMDTSPDDEEDDDIYIQHLALDVTDSIARMNEQEFNRQAYALDDIYGVIMSLNTSLYRTAVNGLNRSTKDIASSLRQLLK